MGSNTPPQRLLAPPLGLISWREEAPSHVTTREEVFQLVKHWYGHILDGDLCFFFCGVANPKPKAYYWSRIGRADAAIGKEAVDAAIKEVREEFKRKFNNDRVWETLWHGTEEERAALEGCSDYYWFGAVIPAPGETAAVTGNGSSPSAGK